MIRQVSMPGGETVPALGQGTWRMGERSERRSAETAAIRAGIEHGLTLIDTAEMYGDGSTESFLAVALRGLRDRVFLVSKTYPENASRARLLRTCEESLKRLNTDRLDLYLLHWRGRVPLAETVEAMQALVAAGKIRHWGVSNLDVSDMDELASAGGGGCATNQVLYNLNRRGVEYDLLPWMAGRAMPPMAYSPMDQARLVHRAIGHRRHVAALHPGQKVVLNAAAVQVVQDLIGGAGAAARACQFLHVGDIEVGDAPMADLAGRDQRLHRLHRLGEWHAAAPVQQIEVEPVGVQPLQALLAGPRQAGAGGVLRIGLRNEEHPVPETAEGDGQEALGRAVAVHLCCIDEREAVLDPRPDRGGLRGAAVASLAHPPGALAQRRDRLTAWHAHLADHSTVLHVARSWNASQPP